MSGVPEATTTASAAAATTPEETKEQIQLVEEITPADPKKHAFVTLVMLGDDYVPGALVTAASIRQHGSKASLVVMVTPDVTQPRRELLKKLYDEVIEVPYIEAEIPSNMRKDSKGKVRSWVSKILTRLYALKLTQYEKIALIDVDVYCARNPDNIFTLATPSAIADGLTLEQAEELKGQLFERKGIEQAKQRTGIRGSCILISPSMADYDRAMDMITNKPKAHTVSQVRPSATQTAKARSKFSIFGDDDDDDDDNGAERMTEAQKAAIEAKSSDISVLSGVVDTANLLNTAIASEGEAENMEVIKTYSYGDPKSQMGPDELLFLNLYRDQLYYMHPRFSHISWRNEAGPYGSVFLHFHSECPWNRSQDWGDYAGWDKSALELCASEGMEAIRTYLFERMPILAAKERGETIKFHTVPPKGKGKKPAHAATKANAHSKTGATAEAPVAAAPAAATTTTAAAGETSGTAATTTPAAPVKKSTPHVWGAGKSAAALLANKSTGTTAAAAAAPVKAAAPATTTTTTTSTNKPAWGNRVAAGNTAAQAAAASSSKGNFPTLGK